MKNPGHSYTWSTTTFLLKRGRSEFSSKNTSGTQIKRGLYINKIAPRLALNCHRLLRAKGPSSAAVLLSTTVRLVTHTRGQVGDSHADIGLHIQTPHLLRVHLIQAGLRPFERGIFLRDILYQQVRKNVPLDHQLSRLLVKVAKIADLWQGQRYLVQVK